MATQTKCKAQRRRRAVVAVAMFAAALASSTHGVVQAANSDVCASSMCIANGESECDRETADCPPCMYLLSTGSFSCYDLVDGACPYSDTYTICDSSSSSSSSGSTSSAATSAPSTTTTAPSSTTATPSSTTATPSTTATGGSNSSDSNVAGTVTPIVKTTATTASSSGSAASSLRSSASSSSSSKETSTDSASSSATPTPSSSAAASSSGSGGSIASSATTTSSGKKSSDVVVMAVLIGAAAVGIVVVAVFIAHRVRKRRMLDREPYRSTFGADGAMFAVPAGLGKSSGMHFASRTYSSHLTPTTSNSITVLGGGSENLDNSIVMLADSQTRGVNHQPSAAGVTLLSMSSLSSSTADFALGPQFRPDQSGVVDLAASTASTSSLKTHPASPMTLDASLTRKPVAGPAARAARTNFVPHAIVEGQEDEDEFSSFEQQSRYVRLASAESVIYTKADFAPESSGVSISSSMSSLTDEYDIVDPHTIRDGERRNTELLVRDSEFPKFSAFSESDLLSEDGDSTAGDEEDDDRALAKEHEI